MEPDNDKIYPNVVEREEFVFSCGEVVSKEVIASCKKVDNASEGEDIVDTTEKVADSFDEVVNASEEIEPIKCPVCDASFTNMKTTWKHVQYQHGIKSYKFLCHRCDRRYPGFLKYFVFCVQQAHVSTDDSSDPYQCLICKEKNDERGKLKINSMDGQSAERRHLLIGCRVCGVHTKWQHFREHLQEHIFKVQNSQHGQGQNPSASTKHDDESRYLTKESNNSQGVTDTWNCAKMEGLSTRMGYCEKGEGNTSGRCLENEKSATNIGVVEKVEHGPGSSDALQAQDEGELVAEYILTRDNCTLVPSTNGWCFKWVLDLPASEKSQ